MELSKETNFRVIEQDALTIPCYFYGYFKSPGLKDYPNLSWVNDDYNLIKTKDLDDENCLRIAENLFLVGEKFNLFRNLDYFVMMPLKLTSISSLDKIIGKLINLIAEKLSIKVKLVSDLFLVENYQKFWENRLKLDERQKEIANKIDLKQDYQRFFINKNIIIIDDVVSTGTSIANIIGILKESNDKLNVTALTYGSVYQWEKIYT